MERKTKPKRKNDISAAFTAGIPLIGFAMFGLIPLVFSVYLSFFELHVIDFSELKWVGLSNFKYVLSDENGRFYANWITTLVFALNAPLGIAAGLYVATLLDRTKVAKRFFRSLFFVPYVCSVVVVSLTFKILFRNDAGVVNNLLSFLGFEEMEWLTSSPMMFMGVVLFMMVWKGLGYTVVLYQAALANVDASYYEAARMDGASSFQIFWKITWPAITPTTSYLVTMKLIGAFQAMSELYILVRGKGNVVPTWLGGKSYVNDTVVSYIYEAIFERPLAEGFGIGSAAGWILALVVILITWINLKLQKRWVCYDF